MSPANHPDEPQICERQETHARLTDKISFAGPAPGNDQPLFTRWIEA
jgi:hypothetical protein